MCSRPDLLTQVKTGVLKWVLMEGQNPEYQGSQTSRLYCSTFIDYLFIVLNQEMNLLPFSGERMGY
jgi:hypothetical protein